MISMGRCGCWDGTTYRSLSFTILPGRLRGKSVYTQYTVGVLHNGADANITSGCSKGPFRKAAASEEARRTLRYVEPLSDARTMLADFFSILLD
jgi:hypothetical protein